MRIIRVCYVCRYCYIGSGEMTKVHQSMIEWGKKYEPSHGVCNTCKPGELARIQREVNELKARDEA